MLNLWGEEAVEEEVSEEGHLEKDSPSSPEILRRAGVEWQRPTCPVHVPSRKQLASGHLHQLLVEGKAKGCSALWYSTRCRS